MRQQEPDWSQFIDYDGMWRCLWLSLLYKINVLGDLFEKYFFMCFRFCNRNYFFHFLVKIHLCIQSCVSSRRSRRASAHFGFQTFNYCQFEARATSSALLFLHHLARSSTNWCLWTFPSSSSNHSFHTKIPGCLTRNNWNVELKREVEPMNNRSLHFQTPRNLLELAERALSHNGWTDHFTYRITRV